MTITSDCVYYMYITLSRLGRRLAMWRLDGRRSHRWPWRTRAHRLPPAHSVMNLMRCHECWAKIFVREKRNETKWLTFPWDILRLIFWSPSRLCMRLKSWPLISCKAKPVNFSNAPFTYFNTYTYDKNANISLGNAICAWMMIASVRLSWIDRWGSRWSRWNTREQWRERERPASAALSTPRHTATWAARWCSEPDLLSRWTCDWSRPRAAAKYSARLCRHLNTKKTSI